MIHQTQTNKSLLGIQLAIIIGAFLICFFATAVIMNSVYGYSDIQELKKEILNGPFNQTLYITTHSIGVLYS